MSQDGQGAREKPREGVLTDDRRCFACGPDNAAGLRMTFAYGDGTAKCTVIPRRDFAGWSDIMHGGIVVTLLDEAMAHAVLGAGVRAVTARIEVRFRKAVPTELPLVAEGIVRGRRGRVLEVDGTLAGEDGTLFAESHARFVAETTVDRAVRA
jgi:acyl-coenzyme A thioesterase PaaI-like protein